MSGALEDSGDRSASETVVRAKGRIGTFIARYSPEVARQFRTARATLRRLCPRGYELVYDNYNALGCGFSPTLRSSDIVISVVAYPRWVTLFFFNGRRLDDPGKLLQGSGVRERAGAPGPRCAYG